MVAAESVMVRECYSALTVDALSGAAGTTRPTFYRRFPNVGHLALAVITQRFGTGHRIDTGPLREDLLVLQSEEVAMFTDPLLAKNLLGLLVAAADDAALRKRCHEAFIAPRRHNAAAIVRAAVERNEVEREPEEAELDFVCELLLGPVLARVLLPGAAPVDDDLAHRTVEAALQALRAP